MVTTNSSMSCPKCGGRVCLDSDYHGFFTFCLQCGYTRDLPHASVIMKSAAGQPDRMLRMVKSDSH